MVAFKFRETGLNALEYTGIIKITKPITNFVGDNIKASKIILEGISEDGLLKTAEDVIIGSLVAEIKDTVGVISAFIQNLGNHD